MKSLQEFYNDKDTAKNVKEFLLQTLREEAVRKVFAREPVEGVAEAAEVIEVAFEKLDELFAPKPIKNNNNESR